MTKPETQKVVDIYAPLTLAVLTGPDFAKLLNNNSFYLMLIAVHATIKQQQKKIGGTSTDTEASVMFILGYLAAQQGWWGE